MGYSYEELKNILAGEKGIPTCDKDIVISRGSTAFQSFTMPFNVNTARQLVITYVQQDKILVEKSLSEVTISEEDNHVLFFTLSEKETFRFEESYFEAKVQFKAELDDGSIITSRPERLIIVEDLCNKALTAADAAAEIVADVYVNDQKLSATVFKKLIEKSENLYLVKFIFDNTWTMFSSITAIFTDEYNHKIEVALDRETNECSIPFEVLSGPGRIYISLIGTTAENEEGVYTKPTKKSEAIRVYRGA